MLMSANNMLTLYTDDFVQQYAHNITPNTFK